MSRELRQEAINDLARVEERLEDTIKLAAYEPTGKDVLVQAIGAIGREVGLIAEILAAHLSGNLDD